MKQFVNESYKHSDITGKVIGYAMKVHSSLGNGFQEVIYQKCLAIEMEMHGLKFSRELEMEYFMKDLMWVQGVLTFLLSVQ